MTNVTEIKLENSARELLTSGMEPKKVIATLILNEDCAVSAAQKAVKAAGGVTAKVSFASEYYDWLAAEERTEEEATDYINGDDGYDETSANIKKHLSHYLAIHSLTVKVYNA